MKAFDFDNTIYKGESCFDFALFVMKKNKKLLKYFPDILHILISYKFKRMSVEEYTLKLNRYTKIVLENKEEIKKLVKDFWTLHERNLYLNMLEKIKRNDVIITSSPDFLMEGIKHRLHTKHILCTKIDFEKGRILYLNFNKNKVKLFQKEYPKKKIDTFYTDSFNDIDFMKFSKNVYLVTHGDCKKIK